MESRSHEIIVLVIKEYGIAGTTRYSTMNRVCHTLVIIIFFVSLNIQTAVGTCGKGHCGRLASPKMAKEVTTSGARLCLEHPDSLLKA